MKGRTRLGAAFFIGRNYTAQIHQRHT